MEQHIYGFHAISARLSHSPEQIKKIYLSNQRLDKRCHNLIKKIQELGIDIEINQNKLASMAPESGHQGIVALVSQRKNNSLEEVISQAKLLVVLDGVTDPHNLGAIIRSAECAGADGILAPKNRACGITAIVEKTASGATQTMPYIQVTNLARTLKNLDEEGFLILGCSEASEFNLYEQSILSLQTSLYKEKGIAWVLGSEGFGLRRLTQEHCHQLVKIPMFGMISSLNVSVTAAICLYETQRLKGKLSISSEHQ